MENSEKGKEMYRLHEYDKYSYLGQGEMKMVQKCIIAFKVEHFYPLVGTPWMGHHDA